MRAYSAEILAALEARNLVARDFVWFIARDRTTGDPVPEGLWSDIGLTTVNVIDPVTGLSQSRQFYGSGGLVQISDIPLVANLTIQQVTVTLSHLDGRAQNLVRTYDCKQAVIQIFRGLYDERGRTLVYPATARFVGFIDNVDIETPPEGEFGKADLTCVSNTQELTRSNPDTRSHVSQQLRHSGDNFFKDVGVVGEQEFWWGQEKTKKRKKKARRKRRPSL